MRSSTAVRRRVPRLIGATAALTGALVLASCVPEPGTPPTTTVPDVPETPSVWGYTKESFDTNVKHGYQLALDTDNRSVYLTDTYWHRETRNADTGEITVDPGTGKVIEFDVESRSFVRNHSFLGLTRNNGNGTEGENLDWTGVTANSLNSMRTHFSPYGIAVDGTTVNPDTGEVDPTIITTTARQQGQADGYNYGGGLVVYRASQGAPTDDDRIWKFEDGSPVLNGPRRVAVNRQTHKAYVTNLGSATQPGFIAVIDLQTRNVDARVTIPAEANDGHAYPGAVGVTVDEDRNLVYVGSINGTKLFVIDAGAVDTSDPKSLSLNDGAITELDAVVHSNARPTYNAELERLYVSSYPERGGIGVITEVDADTDSATYGQVLDTITGPEGAQLTTNAVEIDGERGLLYSADLGAREVSVYDTDDNERILSLPTSGNALNLGIDPVTRELWVSNFQAASKVDVFTIDELTEHTTNDGAKLYLPSQWYEGRPLAASGTGWKNFPGTLGSTIAVKYNQGETSPVPDLGHPGDGVWDVIQASDTDGSWTTQLPFPGPSNSDSPFVAGSSYRVHLLTGSLGVDDVIRSGGALVPVVSAAG